MEVRPKTGQPTNPAVSGHTTPTVDSATPLARLDFVPGPTHARVGQPVPDFKATVIIGRRFEQVSSQDVLSSVRHGSVGHNKRPALFHPRTLSLSPHCPINGVGSRFCAALRAFESILTPVLSCFRPQEAPVVRILARSKTSSSIRSVSRPVKVFCWLTW